MNVAITILAAGASRRMGKAKQLLDWGTKKLLEHSVVQALDAELGDVFVVLGAQSESIEKSITDYPVSILYNTKWKSGLGSSIVCAMETIVSQDYDAVLILLADQPEVNSNYLKKIAKAFQRENKSILATIYQDKNGVPAIFERKHFKELQALKEDRGAAQLIKRYEKYAVFIAPEQYFSDLDTLEEYNKLYREYFLNITEK